MANENKKYKDSVFCDLFYSDQNAKENILSLYNALYGANVTDPNRIGLVRLENVLFRNYKNDVAFTVGKRNIILSEHQSTVNPNMPLRFLLYVARELEKMVPVKGRYSRKLVRIPIPSFLIFYNGVEDQPMEQSFRLSEAFEEVREEARFGNLELEVKFLNINTNKGHPILQKCEVLRQYSEFVETVRDYGREENSLEEAVKECIGKGILDDYLKRKGSEVVNMLMTEYDYDMDMEVNREEGREEGRIAMLASLIEKGFLTLEQAAGQAGMACEDLRGKIKLYH